jgi:hypothetical protein
VITRTIAICGLPATGKSRVMLSLLRRLFSSPFKEGLVVGHIDDGDGIIVLGDYSDPEHLFPGTDRLSMAAPSAVAGWFARMAASPKQWSVVFEGDRLMCAPVLEAAKAAGPLTIWQLETSPAAQEARRATRPASQSEAWRKGRATKLANLAATYGVELVRHETAADTMAIAVRLRTILLGHE